MSSIFQSIRVSIDAGQRYIDISFASAINPLIVIKSLDTTDISFTRAIGQTTINQYKTPTGITGGVDRTLIIYVEYGTYTEHAYVTLPNKSDETIKAILCYDNYIYVSTTVTDLLGTIKVYSLAAPTYIKSESVSISNYLIYPNINTFALDGTVYVSFVDSDDTEETVIKMINPYAALNLENVSMQFINNSDTTLLTFNKIYYSINIAANKTVILNEATQYVLEHYMVIDNNKEYQMIPDEYYSETRSTILGTDVINTNPNYNIKLISTISGVYIGTNLIKYTDKIQYTINAHHMLTTYKLYAGTSVAINNIRYKDILSPSLIFRGLVTNISDVNVNMMIQDNTLIVSVPNIYKPYTDLLNLGTGPVSYLMTVMDTKTDAYVYYNTTSIGTYNNTNLSRAIFTHDISGLFGGTYEYAVYVSSAATPLLLFSQQNITLYKSLTDIDNKWFNVKYLTSGNVEVQFRYTYSNDMGPLTYYIRREVIKKDNTTEIEEFLGGKINTNSTRYPFIDYDNSLKNYISNITYDIAAPYNTNIFYTVILKNNMGLEVQSARKQLLTIVSAPATPGVPYLSTYEISNNSLVVGSFPIATIGASVNTFLYSINVEYFIFAQAHDPSNQPISIFFEKPIRMIAVDNFVKQTYSFAAFKGDIGKPFIFCIYIIDQGNYSEISRSVPIYIKNYPSALNNIDYALYPTNIEFNLKYNNSDSTDYTNIRIYGYKSSSQITPSSSIRPDISLNYIIEYSKLKNVLNTQTDTFVEITDISLNMDLCQNYVYNFYPENDRFKLGSLLYNYNHASSFGPIINYATPATPTLTSMILNTTTFTITVSSATRLFTGQVRYYWEQYTNTNISGKMTINGNNTNTYAISVTTNKTTINVYAINPNNMYNSSAIQEYTQSGNLQIIIYGTLSMSAIAGLNYNIIASSNGRNNIIFNKLDTDITGTLDYIITRYSLQTGSQTIYNTIPDLSYSTSRNIVQFNYDNINKTFNLVDSIAQALLGSKFKYEIKMENMNKYTLHTQSTELTVLKYPSSVTNFVAIQDTPIKDGVLLPIKLIWDVSGIHDAFNAVDYYHINVYKETGIKSDKYVPFGPIRFDVEISDSYMYEISGILSGNSQLLEYGRTYYFIITAVNSTGMSIQYRSNTLLYSNIPNPVMFDTFRYGNNSITLRWNNVTNANDMRDISYVITRKLQGQPEVNTTYTLMTTEKIDTTVINGVIYMYSIYAINSAGYQSNIYTVENIKTYVAPSLIDLSCVCIPENNEILFKIFFEKNNPEYEGFLFDIVNLNSTNKTLFTKDIFKEELTISEFPTYMYTEYRLTTNNANIINGNTYDISLSIYNELNKNTKFFNNVSVYSEPPAAVIKSAIYDDVPGTYIDRVIVTWVTNNRNPVINNILYYDFNIKSSNITLQPIRITNRYDDYEFSQEIILPFNLPSNFLSPGNPIVITIDSINYDDTQSKNINIIYTDRKVTSNTYSFIAYFMPRPPPNNNLIHVTTGDSFIDISFNRELNESPSNLITGYIIRLYDKNETTIIKEIESSTILSSNKVKLTDILNGIDYTILLTYTNLTYNVNNNIEQIVAQDYAFRKQIIAYKQPIFRDVSYNIVLKPNGVFDISFNTLQETQECIITYGIGVYKGSETNHTFFISGINTNTNFIKTTVTGLELSGTQYNVYLFAYNTSYPLLNPPIITPSLQLFKLNPIFTFSVPTAADISYSTSRDSKIQVYWYHDNNPFSSIFGKGAPNESLLSFFISYQNTTNQNDKQILEINGTNGLTFTEIQVKEIATPYRVSIIIKNNHNVSVESKPQLIYIYNQLPPPDITTKMITNGLLFNNIILPPSVSFNINNPNYILGFDIVITEKNTSNKILHKIRNITGLSNYTTNNNARSLVNYQISGLTNGITYIATIYSVNDSYNISNNIDNENILTGRGVEFTPINLPNKPTINSLVEDNKMIIVTWSVIDNSSNPITSIIVYLKKSTETLFDSFSTLSPNTTSFKYNVLNGQSYSIKVVAINNAGSTESDIATSNLIIGPPNDILGLVAYGVNESIYLQWTPPQSNISNPISDYKIFYRVNNGVEIYIGDLPYISTQNNYTLTRLQNGSRYTIRMYAINKVNGIEKFRSNEITINNIIPYIKPIAINTLNIQRNQNTIEVYWINTVINTSIGIILNGDISNITYVPYINTLNLTNKYIITGLTIGISYEVTIFPYNVAYNTYNLVYKDISNTIVKFSNIYLIGSPSAPTSVSVIKYNNKSIDISWSTVSSLSHIPVNGYWIKYGYVDNTYLYKEIVGKDVNTTSLDISNGEIYTVEVRSYNSIYGRDGERRYGNPTLKQHTSSGVFDYSEPYGFESLGNTINNVVTYGKPQDVSGISTIFTDGSIQFQWSSPLFNKAEPIQSYIFNVSGLTVSDNYTYTISDPNITTYTISGLLNADVYNITIKTANKAFTSNGYSLLNQTPYGAPYTVSGIDFIAFNRTNKVMPLQWSYIDSSTNPIRNFDISYVINREGATPVVVKGISGASRTGSLNNRYTLNYTIVDQNIENIFNYDITITSNGIYETRRSERFKISKIQLPPPPSDIVIFPGDKQFYISWNPPNVNNLSYILSILNGYTIKVKKANIPGAPLYTFSVDGISTTSYLLAGDLDTGIETVNIINGEPYQIYIVSNGLGGQTPDNDAPKYTVIPYAPPTPLTTSSVDINYNYSTLNTEITIRAISTKEAPLNSIIVTINKSSFIDEFKTTIQTISGQSVYTLSVPSLQLDLSYNFIFEQKGNGGSSNFIISRMLRYGIPEPVSNVVIHKEYINAISGRIRITWDLPQESPSIPLSGISICGTFIGKVSSWETYVTNGIPYTFNIISVGRGGSSPQYTLSGIIVYAPPQIVNITSLTHDSSNIIINTGPIKNMGSAPIMKYSLYLMYGRKSFNSNTAIPIVTNLTDVNRTTTRTFTYSISGIQKDTLMTFYTVAFGASNNTQLTTISPGKADDQLILRTTTMSDRLAIHKVGGNINFKWNPLVASDYSGIQIQLFGHMSQHLSDYIPLSSAYDISFNISPEFINKQYVMYVTLKISSGASGSSTTKISRKFPIKVLNTDVPYFPRDLYMFITNESIRPI